MRVPGGPVVRESLSRSQARRIALAAQGFAEPRPRGRVERRHVRRVLERVGVLQLDSVNVLARTHYLPVFSRLGGYPRSVLDRMAWGGQDRELFEYWAHVASLVPIRVHPLLRWRMRSESYLRWGKRLEERRPGFVDEVRALVAAEGPIGGGAVAPEGPRSRLGMWDWHDGKEVLEWMFATGEVTAASRPHFERLYDLTERVLPAAVLDAPTPSTEDAQRELTRIAARCHGVATEPELRDYFRLPPRDSQARVAELVAAGELRPVASTAYRSLPTCRRMRRCPAGCGHGRCSQRSTRWSGSGRAPSGSSASATASRSTSRRPSASTATTCCPSCSTTRSSPGST